MMKRRRNMEELEELKERLEKQRPAEWDALPDLSLYMDQVIGYMPRQFIEYAEEDRLTSAMVNNYIKDGLLPRAEGKRYSRVHLAYLTALCALKQVLPMKDAGLLAQAGCGQVEERYEHFRRALDGALGDTAAELDTGCSQEELPQLALALALRSYADKLACQRVIQIIREKTDQGDGKSKKAERKQKHE